MGNSQDFSETFYVSLGCLWGLLRVFENLALLYRSNFTGNLAGIAERTTETEEALNGFFSEIDHSLRFQVLKPSTSLGKGALEVDVQIINRVLTSH